VENIISIILLVFIIILSVIIFRQRVKVKVSEYNLNVLKEDVETAKQQFKDEAIKIVKESKTIEKQELKDVKKRIDKLDFSGINKHDF